MEDFKILDGYLDEEGKLKSMPGKRQKKKLEAMLLYLVSKFEYEKEYTEVQVNEIINAQTTFKDPATLRRLMWGSRLLKRTLDGTSYWRIKSE
jgi:hypothetical protein